jgi:DNA repair exonuclease SbcCD ATPase subunit
MATACVEQAQMLRVLDGAGGLQQQLQRAAATAGADSTAASALSLIDEFGREHVGTERANSTKPLRRALNFVQQCEEHLAAAQRAHQEYLRRAEEADRLRTKAERADAVARAHEAAASRHEADEQSRRLRRATELNAALGDVPPTRAADDDAVAQQVTGALTRWRSQPSKPVLSGPAAAQLQAQIDAVPSMPEGDLDVHANVMHAQDALSRAEAQLAELETGRPQAPAAGGIAPGATDQELLDLAHALAAPVPATGPDLEASAEKARRDLSAARPRTRTVKVILAAAGTAAIAAAALLAARYVMAGAAGLVIAVVLAAIGLARRRSRSGTEAQRRLAEAEGKLDTARQQASEALHKNNEATRRCDELGLDADPAIIRQAVAERARAAYYRDVLAGWESRRAKLQAQDRKAADDLMGTLAARGHPAPSRVPGDRSSAVEEYRKACARRARQAQQASRREHLAAQLEARQQQEHRAETDQEDRGRAAALVAEAGAACGLPAAPAETMAASLEKWQEQRAEQTAEADKARQQAAELKALLSGRTLADLAQEAEAAARYAERLAAGADRGLLAATDPVHAAGELPGLREEAREAGNQAATAEGELRQFAASVPSVPEAEEALEADTAELSRVRQLQQTLGLTRQFLADAQERVHRDIAPVLAATLKQWLPGITADRYTDAIVDPGTLRVQVCGPPRRWRPAERLSYGTAEQIYLLLRIALADHLTQGRDTCPLILDDVTVHADPARTRAILALLLEIAVGRQVILFSQEDQVARWAREHLTGPDHAVRTLPRLPPD